MQTLTAVATPKREIMFTTFKGRLAALPIAPGASDGPS